jgi:cyclophilin family peptidyl-prolyl cis-trans isomerase
MRTVWRRIGSWTALAAGFAAFGGSPALAGGPMPDCDPIPAAADRRVATLETDFGDIRFELLDKPGEVPATVANFLNYVNRGDYDGSFFHRLAKNFVLQGGGYTYDPVDRYAAIETDPPITNEYKFCNVRGTVAMAKLGGQINSATSQFFINLVDNTLTLDPVTPTANGGFTVFARVVPADMAIVDQIGALHWEWGPFMVDDVSSDLTNAWTQLPVKHIVQRPTNGFGTCLEVVDPDPNPQVGPTGRETCPDQATLNAAVEVWKENMDPRLPPELVMLERIEPVPEPGAVAMLGVGAGVLAGARYARRRNARA